MLKDIVIESRDIALPGGNSITVRGLTLENLSSLLGTYKPELTQIFNGKMSVPDLTTKAPLFTATLIAVAAGEPDAVEQARNLPLGAQLIALEAIWDLTLPDEKALGKLLERVETLVAPKYLEKKGSAKELPEGLQPIETGGKEISSL